MQQCNHQTSAVPERGTAGKMQSPSQDWKGSGCINIHQSLQSQNVEQMTSRSVQLTRLDIWLEASCKDEWLTCACIAA